MQEIITVKRKGTSILYSAEVIKLVERRSVDGTRLKQQDFIALIKKDIPFRVIQAETGEDVTRDYLIGLLRHTDIPSLVLYALVQNANINESGKLIVSASKGYRRHRKLTEEQVSRIRTLYLEGTSQCELAVMCKVARSTIADIVRNRTWRI